MTEEEYTWDYTSGSTTVTFIPIGRTPIWKGDARTSERQLIGTKISEISVFGALSARLALPIFLEEFDEVTNLILLDATTGLLTMDGGTTKNVTLMVAEVGAAELDGSFLAKVTFVEA